jgi:pyruvate/2-oxoglutarate dehydrogenase complex dihydrolipoamide acyltransferase (E2) component
MSAESKVMAVAKQLADDHGIDAARLVGTGPGGAVCVADVSHAILDKNAILAAQAAAGVPRMPSLEGSAQGRGTVGAPSRRQAPTAPADSAVAGYAAACGVSDEEASAMLWRLGARAGLKPPPEQAPAPMLTNPDGSMWSPTDNRYRYQ